MIKLAVPNNKIYSFFTSKASDFQNLIKIYTVSEKDTSGLLLNHEVDAAILTPLGYSGGIKNHDLRIIPSTALAAFEYTGLASIKFKSGIDEIRRLGTESADDFLLIIARILMSEKYGIGTKPEIITEVNADVFDMQYVWEKSTINQPAFDITDEWFDTYEMPLPIAFWACRYEDSPEHITEITRSLAGQIDETETINDINPETNTILREGKLIRVWNDDVEASLEQVLKLLYFHQLSNEIAAVKLLGRD